MRCMIAGAASLLVLISACAGRTTLPAVSVPAPLLAPPYEVHTGDVLDVKFEYHPNDSGRFTVGTDGQLMLPTTGVIHAAGLTVADLEELIQKRSARLLRNPVVTITIVQSEARAYVGGEVANPGFVPLRRPMTALQAILERGGFTPGANVSEIVVLSHVAGKPVARYLDLEKNIKKGNAEETLLAADDILLVPKTGIAKANQWVAQWLDGMTPVAFRSIRFGTIDVWGE